MGGVVVALTYFLITGLCVWMSAISTYNGYLSTFHSLTLPFTIVVAAGLFACDYVILDRRSKGLSIWGPAFVLLLFTAMSAASNYNSFYSSLMSGEIASARTKTAQQVFENNLKAVETAIKRELRLPAIRAEIEKDRSNVANEIQNQKKGFGAEARRYIESIRGHLRSIPREIVVWTPPAPPGTDAGNKAALTDFNRIVDEALRQAEAADPWSKGLDEIKRARTEGDRILRGVAAPAASSNSDANIKAVDEIALITRRLEQNILQIFDTTAKQRPAISLVPVATDGMKLFDLAESIRSGFYERPNIWKTWLAAAAAVMIDVLPLIFALVLIKPPRKKKNTASAGDGEEENVVFRDPITGPPRPLDVYKRPDIIAGQQQRKNLRKAKG